MLLKLQTISQKTLDLKLETSSTLLTTSCQLCTMKAHKMWIDTLVTLKPTKNTWFPKLQECSNRNDQTPFRNDKSTFLFAPLWAFSSKETSSTLFATRCCSNPELSQRFSSAFTLQVFTIDSQESTPVCLTGEL